MNATVKETSYLSPIFFSQFPGIDSNKKVEELGATMGKSIEKWTFIYFPMGQGQEDGSNKMLEGCTKKGKMNYVTKPSLNVKMVQKICKWIGNSSTNCRFLNSDVLFLQNLQHYVL